MITLEKIIESINFEDKRIQSDPNWGELANHFDIFDLGWSDDTRLKAYHVKTWLCTDSWVGWEAYFLDNEFVYLSSQNARKSDVDFEFVSKEAGIKVRDYLLSLTSNERENYIPILDLKQEFPEKYKIEYNSQILHRTAWFGAEKVKIKKTRYAYDSVHYFHTVEIENEKGEVLEVDCRDLEFEYNTLD